jgi:hypothetical protein
MRPRWLRGWSWWVDTRPTGDATDRRPIWQRVAVFIGLRREW